MNLDILNLTVSEQRPFFLKQVEVLQERGINSNTIRVPGEGERPDRTFLEYIKYHPMVLKESVKEYDLIHANCGLTSPSALFQPNRPIVVTFWGDDLMRYGHITKRCADHFDAVIVRSAEMKQMLDCDAYIIPSGVDMNLFTPSDTDEAKTELGWNTDDYHVIFPYSPKRPKKNYDLAKEVVNECGLDTNIHLHYMHDMIYEDMPMYYNAADALLLTSEREGSPNTVKEALACNLPVVSTDVGDVKKRIENVDYSYVGETKEELIGQLKEVLVSNQRTNGREYVREVSLENMGDKILNVYKDVL